MPLACSPHPSIMPASFLHVLPGLVGAWGEIWHGGALELSAFAWGLDGPPGATGVLSGRGGRKRGSPLRSVNEVIHLIQGCHCALLQKLCKLPKSQTLNPYSGAEF